MAKKYNAEVALLHILEMPSSLILDWYGGAVPVIDTGAIWQAETEAAQSYLTDRFKALRSTARWCKATRLRPCTIMRATTART
jgi:hypothetical protein